jgi:hypothetical protein
MPGYSFGRAIGASVRSIASGARYSMFQDQHQSRRPWRHLFFLAVSAARRAAHTGQEADGITAGCVHGTSGRWARANSVGCKEFIGQVF